MKTNKTIEFNDSSIDGMARVSIDAGLDSLAFYIESDKLVEAIERYRMARYGEEMARERAEAKAEAVEGLAEYPWEMGAR